MTTGEDWIADLQQSGYTIVRGILEPARVDLLRRVVEKKLASTKRVGSVGTEKSVQLTQLLFTSMSTASVVRDLFLDQRVQWILSAFHRVPIVDHTKVLVKAAGAPATPWHQDHAFFEHYDPTGTMLTLWTPLTPVDSRNGTIRLLRGAPPAELLPHEIANDGREKVVRADVLSSLSEQGEVTPDVAPGDAVIFNSRIVHGTFANETDGDRLAFKLVFQDLSRRSKPVQSRGVLFHGVEGVFNRLHPCILTRARLTREMWKRRVKAMRDAR